MRINKMTATFGKLKNSTLELSPGLNIIEAPNEYGKSTWCAFIKAMLYGVDTSERDRLGKLSAKTRMKPWDGGSTAGTMEVTAGGMDITIQRTNQGSAPFKKLTAVYTGTAELVPDLTSESAGETLTGVSEHVFERTAFIRRSELRVNQTSDLEKRISTLVFTGEEQSSFSDAEEELKAWQRRLRYNRIGELPQLEAELREAESARGELDRTADELSTLSANITRLNGQIEGYEQDLVTHDKLDRRAAGRKILEERDKLRVCEERVNRLTEAVTKNGREMTRQDITDIRQAASSVQPLRRVKDDAEKVLYSAEKELSEVAAKKNASPLAGTTEEEAAALSRRARELAAEAEAGHKKPIPRFIPGILFAAAAVMLIIFSGVLSPFSQWLPSIAVFVSFRLWGVLAALVPAVAGIILLLYKPAAPASEKELAEILSKYGANSAEKLASLVNSYVAVLRSEEPAKAARDAARQAFQNAATAVQDAENEAISAISQFMPELRNGYEIVAALAEIEQDIEALTKARFELASTRSIHDTLLSEYGEEPKEDDEYIPRPLRDREDTLAVLERTRKQLELARAEYSELSGVRKTQGDPAVLESRAEALREKIAEDEAKYAALTLAIDTLRDANTELTTRFSPLISKKAGEYFERLTDGRYEKLSFDRGFDANVRTGSDVLDRNVLALSDGATDQVYFSLRLAMCELILGGGDPCPIILDDALINFDDERCREAVDLLSSIADERQVILFTCHHREAEMAGENARVLSFN